MSSADLKDALRAIRWKIRQFFYRGKHGLGFQVGVEHLMADPESCQSMFNLVALGVCLCAPDDLPAEIVVTPSNVLEFLDALDRSGMSLQTATRNDAREVWRRLRKCVEKEKNTESRMTSHKHKCWLRLTVTAERPDCVRFRIAEGEFIPHPEHVEARLGIEPGKPFSASAVDLATLMSSMLVHGHKPADTAHDPIGEEGGS